MFTQPAVLERRENQRTEIAISPILPTVLSSGPDLPILVIDDDEDVRAALSDLLSRWNVAFDVVAHPGDALALVASGKVYRLVMADYRLPGHLTGLDVIEKLKVLHPAPAPSFALITGDFDPDLIRAAQLNRVPLFHKPLRPERLFALISLKQESP